jgi:hypothetical protein
MAQRIETKVIAGAAGSGLGGALASFTTWCLGVFVWDASSSAADAAKALEAVPAPVIGLVAIMVPAITTLGLGLWAPHTHRPDLAPVPDPGTIRPAVETIEQARARVDMSSEQGHSAGGSTT